MAGPRDLHFFFKFVNGILRNWESLCDIRPDCHHHFDASRTLNAMFDELAERSLMGPLVYTKTIIQLSVGKELLIKVVVCGRLKTK